MVVQRDMLAAGVGCFCGIGRSCGAFSSPHFFQRMRRSSLGQSGLFSIIKDGRIGLFTPVVIMLVHGGKAAWFVRQHRKRVGRRCIIFGIGFCSECGFLARIFACLRERSTILYLFQERVFGQHLLQFLLQFQTGELQQADGLLQLR